MPTAPTLCFVVARWRSNAFGQTYLDLYPHEALEMIAAHGSIWEAQTANGSRYQNLLCRYRFITPNPVNIDWYVNDDSLAIYWEPGIVRNHYDDLSPSPNARDIVASCSWRGRTW